MENKEIHELVHSHLASLQETLQELFLSLLKRIDQLDSHLDDIFKGLEQVCSRLDNLESLLNEKPGDEGEKFREAWNAQDEELPSV